MFLIYFYFKEPGIFSLRKHHQLYRPAQHIHQPICLQLIVHPLVSPIVFVLNLYENNDENFKL